MARGQGSQNPEMEPGGGAQEGQGRPGFPTVLDPLFLPAPGASLSLSGAAEQPRLSPGAQPGV